MPKDLSDISGVGPKTVDKLADADLDSIEVLANASVDEIMQAGVSEKRAKKLKTEASECAVLIQTAAERETEYADRDVISTGIDALDEALGGGWLEGDIVSLYGRSGTGKTQVAFHSLVEAVQQTDEPAVYIETEKDRFRPERLKDYADNPDIVDEQVYAVEATDLNAQYNAYGKVGKSFDSLSMVVIDSFNSKFRDSSEYEDRSDLSSRSTAMTAHMKRVEGLSRDLGCPVLMPTQVYSSPNMRGKKDIPYGGNVFLHKVSYMIRLQPGQGDMRQGTVENHPAHPESEILLNITDDDIIGSMK